MRDWRKALQSGGVKALAVAVILADAAGILIARSHLNQAFLEGDEADIPPLQTAAYNNDISLPSVAFPSDVPASDDAAREVASGTNKLVSIKGLIEERVPAPILQERRSVEPAAALASAPALQVEAIASYNRSGDFERSFRSSPTPQGNIVEADRMPMRADDQQDVLDPSSPQAVLPEVQYEFAAVADHAAASQSDPFGNPSNTIGPGTGLRQDTGAAAQSAPVSAPESRREGQTIVISEGMRS